MMSKSKQNGLGPTVRLRGFTLIEVLIAIVIGALVITSAYGSFSVGIKTRKRLSTLSEYLRERREFLDQVSRELRSAISFEPGSISGDGRRIQFHAFLPRELVELRRWSVGNENTLAILSPVITIEYSIATNDAETSIIKKVNNLRGASIESRTFDLHLADFSISYREDIGAGSWLGEWLDRTDFPGAIKLVLKSAEAGSDRGTEAVEKIVVLPPGRRGDSKEAAGER